MKTENLIRRIQSVAVDEPGSPGRIADLVEKNMDLGVSLSRRLIEVYEPEERTNDETVSMAIVFLLYNHQYSLNIILTSVISSSELSRLRKIAIEGAVNVIRLSWLRTSDNDAVEYHYWACGLLSKIASASCEKMISDCLEESQDELIRISLIEALGVLADQNHLKGLSDQTVSRVLRIWKKEDESVKVREAARSAILDDFIRIDSYFPFLSDDCKSEISELIAR